MLPTWTLRLPRLAWFDSNGKRHVDRSEGLQ